MSSLTRHYRQLVGIAKTWATQNLPHWDDATHRDLLSRHGAREKNGRPSASTMTIPQMAAVLSDYERRGWPRRRNVFAKGTQKKRVPPRLAMLIKLWGRLGDSGKVNRATRPALLEWCGRMLKRDVPDLDSLSVADSTHLTEAMKHWIAR